MRSLSISKSQLGADHPDVATSLNNLAILYENQGKFQQAQSMAQRALVIYQTAVGDDHPNTQVILLTVKALQVMGLLQCNKQTLFELLQALVQANNLPALNTETMLMLLDLIASDLELT